MRLRVLYFIVMSVAACAISSFPASAADGAEPAKSTIRIVSATPTAAPEASPQRIVVPSQAAPPNLERRIEQREAVPIRVVSAAPPVQPAAKYTVQQASHAEPNDVAPNSAERHVAAPNTVAASNSAAPNVTAAPRHAPTSGRAPSVVNIHSSRNAQATMNRMPRRMAVQPRPKAPAAPSRGKPFQAVQMEPAVSAYLNMYRRDSDGGNVPNYFAFVLPQLEQQEATRQQAAELQKLRGQVQGFTSAGGAPPAANMGAHARYMDTAQYYGGMKR